MQPIHLFSQAVFAAVACVFLIGLGVRAVQHAKSGSAGAHVLGAAFLFFAIGNMRDPTDEIAQQAKQLKRRDEDASGDPPNGDDQRRDPC